MAEPITGLACPKCQGRVEVPEGQRIVICPYCDQRSLVRGERGVLRYQVPRRIQREQALTALRGFQQGLNRAPGLARRSELTEIFVAYLPFWSVWAKVAGWVLGEKRVGREEHRRFEPREVQIMRPMNWNAAACDVAEFGVESIQMEHRPLEAFQPERLHEDGMVFEPIGGPEEGERQAAGMFDEEVRALSRLDRIASVVLRVLDRRVGLVYLPLWVARYSHRGRDYQVVVDGHSGRVLYGKAPGNTWYRAAVLVGGMAVGAFVMVDGTALAVSLLSHADEDSLAFLLVPLVVGAGLMLAAYRAFRHGEQIEHREGGLRRTRPSAFSWSSLLGRIGAKIE